MANVSSFRDGVVGPGPDIRFDHCTPFSRVHARGGSRRSNMQLHPRRDTPGCSASNVVHVADQPCLGHLIQAPPPGERDQVLLSKPRQSLPYQFFGNAMRDRNAPRVRKRHLLTTRMCPTSPAAPHPPKHNTRYVSLARVVHGSSLTGRVRLLVIFPAPGASAKLKGDKHKNFIGLKDVPAPIAIFRKPTPLMQVTAANSGASGPRRTPFTGRRQRLLGHTRNFVQTTGERSRAQLWFGPVPLMSTMHPGEL